MKLGWITWFAFAVVGWAVVARADLLVSDHFGDQVLRYDQNTGAYLATVVPFKSGGLDGAIGIRLDANGDLLVSSRFTNSILKYDLYSGAVLGAFASNATPGAQLTQPADLEWGPDGNLYVANYFGSSLSVFTPSGAALGQFANINRGSFINGSASGIFGPDGNLYVTNFYDNGLYVFQGPGKPNPGAFIGAIATSADGTLSGPAGILFDASGTHLYVASLLNHFVFEYNVSTTTNMAGVPSLTSSYLRQFATGTGSFPSSMLFAADGSMLVSETGGTGVYRFDVSNANFGAPLGEFTSGGNPSSPLQVPGEMLYVPNANRWAGPAGGTWATTANWTSGAVPNTNNDAALLWDNLTAAATVDLGGASCTVQRIDFDTHSNTFTYNVQNGTLILDGGGTGNARISAQSTNTNNQTISANIKYNTPTIITNASQNGSLLILSGQQDWNGKAVSVLSGGVKFTPSVNGVNASGASLSIAAGANVELAGTASSTSDGTIGVTVTNNGLLNVTGINQRTGAIGGSGTTNVGTTANSNAALSSNRIVQAALNISRTPTTGDSTPNATATINASSPSSYTPPGGTTVPKGSSSGTSIVSSLSIANNGAGLVPNPAGPSTYYGTLDLSNNNLVIDYTGHSSPVAAIRDAIWSAYHGGAWDGKGLTSSFMSGNPGAQYALALSDNADTSNQFSAFNNSSNMFDGTPVNSQSVLVKFTWQDDLNMDGTVDISDAQIFANSYDNGATSGHTFVQGDLNYDGVVDISDAQIFANAYIISPQLANLPEPSGFVLAALGLAGLVIARLRFRRV